MVHCPDAEVLLQIGSSTVFPVSQAHSVRYPNPLVLPNPLLTGSSLGFKNFLAGGSDIASASRPLKAKDYEAADCDGALVVDGQALGACQGRRPLGLKTATDMLAVVANPADAWLPAAGLSAEQVAQLFAGASPAEVIGPNAPEAVALYVPDAASGTRDFFEEATGVALEAPGFVDDLAIVDGVAGDPDALGFLGRAYVDPARVAAVAVDGVDPFAADAAAQGYAFARPLFKYFDVLDRSKKTFQVVDFLCALLTPEGQAIVANSGYVPLAPAELDAERNALNVKCDDRIGTESIVALDGNMAKAALCRDASLLTLIGSSTVFPIGREAARVYPSPLVIVEARSTGSSIGIADLLAGSVDIGMASRQLKGKDYEGFGCDPALVVAGPDGLASAAGECQGVLPAGVQVGVDQLAVIANPANPFVTSGTSLSEAQLQALFVDQVTYGEALGVEGIGANQVPKLCVPDNLSGTRAFFEEEIGAFEAAGFSNDNALIDCLLADDLAIGFVGVAYVKADPGKVAVAAIDGVGPLDGDAAGYRLTRPLFLYYDASPDAWSKLVDEFLCFMLGPTGQGIVATTGYSPIEPALAASQGAPLLC